jgi:hypothetical protein
MSNALKGLLTKAKINNADDNLLNDFSSMIKHLQQAKLNQILSTTPNHTLREIMIRIVDTIKYTDILDYTSNFERISEIFREHYPLFQPVIISQENCYYIYDINNETKLTGWYKVSTNTLIEKVFKRIETGFIRKMYQAFAEEDPNWARNERINERNMIISRDVLNHGDRATLETWEGLIKSCDKLFSYDAFTSSY